MKMIIVIIQFALLDNVVVEMFAMIPLSTSVILVGEFSKGPAMNVAIKISADNKYHMWIAPDCTTNPSLTSSLGNASCNGNHWLVTLVFL